MRDEPIATKVINGFTVNILPDFNPLDPLEYEFTRIMYKRTSRYTLGNEPATPAEMNEMEGREDVVWRPVYAFVHGDVHISTNLGIATCPFDSGQSGICYVTCDKIRERYGVKRISKQLKAKIYNEVLPQDVGLYNKYLNGECYGWEVLDSKGNVVDSCWGYYDEPEYLFEEAEAAIGDRCDDPEVEDLIPVLATECA